MEKNSVSSLLTPLDNLFTTEQEREEAKRETVIDIPLTEIDDFPHHPFKVRVDENMLEMMDSVREHVVLIPAVVRPKADGKYEMVSGHRRKRASEMVGKEKISCIVRDLTDDEAIIIALRLNLDETQELLATAGLTLSKSFVFDKIIRYFIQKGNYNVYEINEALFEFDQVLLGC